MARDSTICFRLNWVSIPHFVICRKAYLWVARSNRSDESLSGTHHDSHAESKRAKQSDTSHFRATRIVVLQTRLSISIVTRWSQVSCRLLCFIASWFGLNNHVSSSWALRGPEQHPRLISEVPRGGEGISISSYSITKEEVIKGYCGNARIVADGCGRSVMMWGRNGREGWCKIKTLRWTRPRDWAYCHHSQWYQKLSACGDFPQGLCETMGVFEKAWVGRNESVRYRGHVE